MTGPPSAWRLSTPRNPSSADPPLRLNEGESHVRAPADGRAGERAARREKLRVLPTRHLEPEAISFALDDAAPPRELDGRLESGREVAVIVIDKANDPIAGAKVICVHESRICARTTTDEDGRAEIAGPEQGSAMLFAIAQEGPFAMIRAGRERGRLRIHLPSTSSSLQLRALTTDGRTMPPFSLLMRFNGELVPAEVAGRGGGGDRRG